MQNEAEEVEDVQYPEGTSDTGKRLHQRLVNGHGNIDTARGELRRLVQGIRLRALTEQEMRFPLRKIEDSLRKHRVRPRKPGS